MDMAALDAPLFKILPSQWSDDKLLFALGWEAKNEHGALTEVDRYRSVLRQIAVRKEIRRRMANGGDNGRQGSPLRSVWQRWKRL